MKMVMAVVPRKNGDDLLSSLVNAGYSATFYETRGGMLRQSQLSLFIAVREAEIGNVLELVRSSCKVGEGIHQGFGLGIPEETHTESDPTNPGGSGAVVFIWSLDQFELS